MAKQVNNASRAGKFAAVALHQVILDAGKLKDVGIGFGPGGNAAGEKAAGADVPERVVLNYVAGGDSLVIRGKREAVAFDVSETVAVESHVAAVGALHGGGDGLVGLRTGIAFRSDNVVVEGKCEAVEGAIFQRGCAQYLRLLGNHDRIGVGIFTEIGDIGENPGAGDRAVEEPLSGKSQFVLNVFDDVAMRWNVSVRSAGGGGPGEIDEMVDGIDAADPFQESSHCSKMPT